LAIVVQYIKWISLYQKSIPIVIPLSSTKRGLLSLRWSKFVRVHLHSIKTSCQNHDMQILNTQLQMLHHWNNSTGCMQLPEHMKYRLSQLYAYSRQ